MLAYDALGRPADAERQRAKIQAAGAKARPLDRVIMDLRQGNHADAIDVTERVLGRDGDFWAVGCDPLFDLLKTDRHFLDLMARRGISVYPASGPQLIRPKR